MESRLEEIGAGPNYLADKFEKAQYQIIDLIEGANFLAGKYEVFEDTPPRTTDLEKRLQLMISPCRGIHGESFL